MRERLFIRLAIHVKDPIDWCIVGSDGLTITESGRLNGIHELGELTVKAKGKQSICFVPGNEVLMTSVQFPASQRRQIRRALPFMLEEQLVNPLETSHFAIPDKVNTEDVPVVVASKDKMTEWMELFEAVQIEPDYLMPDCLALPMPENCWVVLKYDDFVLVRESLGKAWVAEQDMLEMMLELQRPKTDEGDVVEQDVLVYGDDSGEIQQLLADKGMHIAINDTEAPLYLLAESFNTQSINLLQGDYSLRQDYGEILTTFKGAIAAVVAFLVIQGSWLVMQSSQLEKEYKAIRSENLAIWKEVFPGNRRIPPRAEKKLRSELAKLQSGVSQDGFLGVLSKIYRGLQSGSGVTPSSINYDAKRNEMKIDINAKDIATLERFKEQTANLGYEVKLGNVNQQESGHRGRVVITGK